VGVTVRIVVWYRYAVNEPKGDKRITIRATTPYNDEQKIFRYLGILVRLRRILTDKQFESICIRLHLNLPQGKFKSVCIYFFEEKREVR